MEFLNALEERYTCKKYDPSVEIPEEVINKLKKILLLSPSSINSQPWHFTFIQDDTVKNNLSRVSFHNTDKVKDCSHLIVFSVIGNMDLFHDHLSSLSPRVQQYYALHIETLSDDKIRAWMLHQLYITLGVFLGACASYNIDSTPMEGIERDSYKHMLQLDNYDPIFAVAIGRRHMDDPNQLSTTPKSRRSLVDVIRDI